MKVRWAVAVIAVVLLLAAWLLRSEAPARAVEPPPAVVIAVPAPVPTAAPEPVAVAPPAPILAARALASAQTTVQSQLSLLGDNQYDLFVQTFAQSLRPSITREVFDACRVRINQLPVKPDWEVAEERTENGRRILAVSIFGKSMTDFEETDGRWLAGSLWCVPVGLP